MPRAIHRITALDADAARLAQGIAAVEIRPFYGVMFLVPMLVTDLPAPSLRRMLLN